MRKLFYFIYSLIITTPLLHAQLNLTQLGKLTYPAAKGNLSDIWGYVDTTGKEYAIVGLQKGVSIVDVSNPSNPVEVFLDTRSYHYLEGYKNLGKVCLCDK